METESRSSRDADDDGTKPSPTETDAEKAPMAEPEVEAPGTDRQKHGTVRDEGEHHGEEGGARRSRGWFNDPRSLPESSRRGWWDRG